MNAPSLSPTKNSAITTIWCPPPSLLDLPRWSSKAWRHPDKSVRLQIDAMGPAQYSNAAHADNIASSPDISLNPPNAARQSHIASNRDPSIRTPQTSNISTPINIEEPQLCSLGTHTDLARMPNEDSASSWSTSTDKELQLGSDGTANDRVFPIRSVVRVDHSQTSHILPTSSDQPNDYFTTRPIPPVTTRINIASSQRRLQSQSDNSTPLVQGQNLLLSSSGELGVDGKLCQEKLLGSERYGGGRRMQIFSDSASESTDMSVSTSAQSSPYTQSHGFRGSGDYAPDLLTTRFKHIVTEEGHVVITGRDGEKLQRCEDEPIHIPGAVQSFGLLVALEDEPDGHLVVRIVSENSQRIIGYTPQELFCLKSFLDIFSEEQAENLLDHVDCIRDEECDPSINGPEVFTVTLRAPRTRRTQKLWCGIHIHPSYPDRIICEFELEEDPEFPLTPPGGEEGEVSANTLQSMSTNEEYVESTEITSKPLRVLKKARKLRGEEATMQVFNIMSQVQEQLASAPNLDIFLKVLVGVIKELTGFHRVMIYQFDSSFNGKVVTELVDPRTTKDLYRGLNFPASDIPKQARELYKINKVRLLYDRELETARLVCRTVEDLERPLDLSYSYLRAMSPIHIKYLGNMAVRSSMSISINAFGKLWGLIACHSYGKRGMRVSFPIRKMCHLVGDTALRNIERLSYASRLQARKLFNTIPTEANPSGCIVAPSDDLLKLFDADFGILSIRGKTKIMGKPQQTHEALAMLEYLRMRQPTAVITSKDIRSDFPELCYPPGFDLIAGLLLVPLSAGGTDLIVFFRKGQAKEVKWAGNPYEQSIQEGTESYLEVRKSFKTWSEIVVGNCRDWTEEQVETAAVLCLVYGKLIEVWRQKEAAVESSQLTRLLLANSAHEVRTPLNAIINYLEIALGGALDQETKDNLTKSHSASKSLICVINDLLDLTKMEEGQSLIKDEVFDLPATFREATDPFKGDASRKQLDFKVTEHPGVPQLVQGDQPKIRQAIANLTANAVQITTSGWVHADIWCEEISDGKVVIDIAVEDSGIGMSDEKLDSLFRDLEQVSSDGDVSPDLNGGDSMMNGSPQVNRRQTLGLGLATVSRTVRNMNGQLRLKSEKDVGSRFVIQLPFSLPMDDMQTMEENTSIKCQQATSTSRLAAEGEVTPIDGSVAVVPGDLSRKRSIEEAASLRSFKSGSSNKSTKSDVDRLIDAISGPVVAIESESVKQGLPQSSSRSSLASRKGMGSVGATPSSAHSSTSAQRSRRPSRSRSYGGGSDQLLTHPEDVPGYQFVTDSKTPMSAVRMPDDFAVISEAPHTASKALLDISDKKPKETREELVKLNTKHLQILFAEDDPINSKIMKKRLEKSGHTVHPTVNGEECASSHRAHPSLFDVVLMDIQMPIVDGISSTKMIRSFEKLDPSSRLSLRASRNGRIPVIAVSAQVLEKERQIYIDAGLDGWILKPVDFNRLNTLISGIVDDHARSSALYQPGEWERGGWFCKRHSVELVKTLLGDQVVRNLHERLDPFSSAAQRVNSTPHENSSIPSMRSKGPEPPQQDITSSQGSDSGSITPKNESSRSLDTSLPVIEDITG